MSFPIPMSIHDATMTLYAGLYEEELSEILAQGNDTLSQRDMLFYMCPDQAALKSIRDKGRRLKANLSCAQLPRKRKSEVVSDEICLMPEELFSTHLVLWQETALLKDLLGSTWHRVSHNDGVCFRRTTLVISPGENICYRRVHPKVATQGGWQTFLPARTFTPGLHSTVKLYTSLTRHCFEYNLGRFTMEGKEDASLLVPCQFTMMMQSGAQGVHMAHGVGIPLWDTMSDPCFITHFASIRHGGTTTSSGSPTIFTTAIAADYNDATFPLALLCLDVNLVQLLQSTYCHEVPHEGVHKARRWNISLPLGSGGFLLPCGKVEIQATTTWSFACVAIEKDKDADVRSHAAEQALEEQVILQNQLLAIQEEIELTSTSLAHLQNQEKALKARCL